MEQQNIFQGIEEELRNPYLSREEKLQLIEQTGEKYRQQIQKEYEAYRNKQIAAGILEIGSAAISAGGVTGAIGKKLAPKAIPYLQPILKQHLQKKRTTKAYK